MPADEELHHKSKRGPRLAGVLGAAFVVCALAFTWVAVAPLRKPAETIEKFARSTARKPPAAGASASSGAAGRVTISVMTLGNELRPEQIAQFEALNPDIRIAFIEHSANLLDILFATNDLPDVIRLGQVKYPPLVQRGLLLDLTERIGRSKRLSPSDMRAEWSTDVAVDGRYYGLPQGLQTPDFASIYINKAAFERAGVALPSLREPLTYAELAAIARKLTARTGRPSFYSYFFERAVAGVLAQAGGRMFNDGFSEMTLTGNPKALEVLRYFYDLGTSGVMHIPPTTPGIAFLFESGELPISQSGYWMGAVVTPAMPAYGKVTMLPPPVWDRRERRVSSYLGGTSLAISAGSRHADQAYRFIEWYATGEPAAERARRGWGFPLLRSMEPLLPRETDFDKQRLQVALDVLKLPVAPLPQYPYTSILPAFNQSWTRNMTLAMSGKIAFPEFASNLQEDVNLAIQDELANHHDLKSR